MNKILYFLIASCCIFDLKAQNLAANFDYSIFNGETPYIETYISVNAATVVYSKNKDGNYQGKINITINLTDELGQTKYYDKYELLSPELEDSSKLNFYFIDQQRIAFSEGEYTLSLKIVDANTSELPYTHDEPIVFTKSKSTSFSSIQLVESYQTSDSESRLSKNGMILNPMASNVFYSEQKKIQFYTELYQQKNSFVFIYFIVSAENDKIIENLAKTKVQKPDNKTRAFIGTLPIEKLPSGSYKLVCEAKNQAGELVAQQEKFFYRINNELNPTQKNTDISGTFVDDFTKKQLEQFIDYLYPIQNNREGIIAYSLMKEQDEELMKKFFYQFWKDRYPLDPQYAWENYLLVVKKVNDEFNVGRIPGYKSDRGRVYLQYGAPNSRITNEHSTRYEKFEVWHYYKIDNQSDCRFVFGHKGTDMDLVLSNVEGETSDKEWLMRFGEFMNQSNFDFKSPMDYFTNPQ